MSRLPGCINQIDVARILRAAKAIGAAEVEVRIDGQSTVLIRLKPSSTGGEPQVEESAEIVL